MESGSIASIISVLSILLIWLNSYLLWDSNTHVLSSSRKIRHGVLSTWDITSFSSRYQQSRAFQTPKSIKPSTAELIFIPNTTYNTLRDINTPTATFKIPISFHAKLLLLSVGLNSYIHRLQLWMDTWYITYSRYWKESHPL